MNFGSLGFLTEITLAELYPTLEGVLADKYQYEERRMLHALVRRHERPDETGDVLNDVVVTKAALSRIIELDVTIDGQHVRVAAALGNLFGDRLELGNRACGEADGRARARERQCDRAPDAAAGAGDDDHLSVEAKLVRSVLGSHRIT